MNRLNNQRGYAFVVVLLFIVFIGLTTITLAGYALNAQKSIEVSRTTVEEKIASEMAMDEALAKIQAKLDLINRNGFTGDSDELVRQLSDPNFTLTRENPYSEDSPILALKIKIPANERGKILTKSIVLTAVSEVFKYSVVSKSDLFLYGKSQINGDVYVNRDLKLSKKVSISVISLFQSDYPSVNGNLTVKRNYEYNDPFLSLFEYWRPIQNPTQTLPNYFTDDPTLRDRTLTFDNLPVAAIINSKSIRFENTYNGNKTVSEPQIITGTARFKNLTIKAGGNLTVHGDLIIGGNLTIEDNGSLLVNGNIYVQNDLLIEQSSFQYRGQASLKVQNNSHIYIRNKGTFTNVFLEAPVYIYGTAEIRNRVNTNSTIYASDINVIGMTKNNSGTLVLVSQNDISLLFNNTEQEAKELDAYLYSNGDVEVWGYASNIILNGGIYGNNVILKARDYRLKVNYKKDLILNPPKGIPTVQKVTMQELKSSYKRE